MNKINITLPIIKINIDYSIRSKEKSGLFEYTILDIYNKFNKSEFENYTFKDFIHKILQAKVPDLFIVKALEYLDNNKILVSEYEDGLIDLSISSFRVFNEKTLETMLEKKELYSKPQTKNIDLYYDPLSNQIINIDCNQLIKDNEKPLINGEQFRHRNITDLTKSAFIEFLKKQESSFYKDGAKVDDIKEQYVSLESENKREILYRNVEVAFTLNQSLNNEYIIEFTEEFKFITPYVNQFITYVFKNYNIFESDVNNNNLIQRTSVKTAYKNDIVLSNINDIEKYIQSEIYLIFNTNENKIETSENYLKVYLNQHFKDIKCFIVKDSIYSYREISINGVFKNVFFYNTHNEEIYNKITADFIKDFIADLFKNIKDKSFYDEIKQLNYFINVANKKELIVDTIINHLISLDIYLFINRIVSIFDILTHNESYLKYFNENIYNRYLEKSNYSKMALNDIFSQWKYNENTIDKVKKIQNNIKDILDNTEIRESMKKNTSIIKKTDSDVNKRKHEKRYVLDTNILISIGVEAFKKNNLILSSAVIEELDDVKKKQSDTFQTINKIQKYLTKFNRDDIVFENSNESINLLPSEYRKDKRDNMILSLCLKDTENRILVTNDQNLQLKAKAINIKSINSGIFLKGEIK